MLRRRIVPSITLTHLTSIIGGASSSSSSSSSSSLRIARGAHTASPPPNHSVGQTLSAASPSSMIRVFALRTSCAEMIDDGSYAHQRRTCASISSAAPNNVSTGPSTDNTNLLTQLCGVAPRPNCSAMAAYCLELFYRSSYGREKLREAIREVSVELALREFGDYCSIRGGGGGGEGNGYGSQQHSPRQQQSHAFSPDVLQSLVSAQDDLERIDIILSDFTQWYFAMRAPEKIKMFEPWTWFPKARAMKRRFIFHVGPTNSGKTHQALEALVLAKSGVYCAPLKALAAQVWRRIDKGEIDIRTSRGGQNNANRNNTSNSPSLSSSDYFRRAVPCDLLIGDERQFGGSAEHVSCTVEMTPCDYMVDVGVIDEVQMLSDRERGWAWTRAILGLPAKEIHLCGEERALGAVKALLRQTREDYSLQIVRHKRLVGLSLGPSLGGDYGNVENGDCIVAFGKNKMFEIKAEIEQSNPTAVVSVIYGGLPFSVREASSDTFNDGVKRRVAYVTERVRCDAEKEAAAEAALDHDGAAAGGSGGGVGGRGDSESTRRILKSFLQSSSSSSSPLPPPIHVLVSTDAIAYGLNMNIRRIVFATMRKFDGKGMIPLPQSTVLQVGGRAGRFGMAFSSTQQHAKTKGNGSLMESMTVGGGLVTTLHHSDLSKVEAAFSSPLPMITKAGLLPTAEILTLFAEMKYGRTAGAATAAGVEANDAKNSGRNISFSQLMQEFAVSMEQHYSSSSSSSSSPSSSFLFPCDMTRSVLMIANALEGIGSGDGVSGEGRAKSNKEEQEEEDASILSFPIKDRIVFCFCPLSDPSNAESIRVLRSYAVDYCKGLAAREKKIKMNGTTSDGDADNAADVGDGFPVRMLVDDTLARILRESEGRLPTAAKGNVINNAAADSKTSTTAPPSSSSSLPPPLSVAEIYAQLATLEWIYRMVEVYGWLGWRLAAGGGTGGGSANNAPSSIIPPESASSSSLISSSLSDRTAHIKALCSAAIRERLEALPRGAAGTPTIARGGGGGGGRGHSNNSNGKNNNNRAERVVFDPKPLVDMGVEGTNEREDEAAAGGAGRQNYRRTSSFSFSPQREAQTDPEFSPRRHHHNHTRNQQHNQQRGGDRSDHQHNRQQYSHASHTSHRHNSFNNASRQQFEGNTHPAGNNRSPRGMANESSSSSTSDDDIPFFSSSRSSSSSGERHQRGHLNRNHHHNHTTNHNRQQQSKHRESASPPPPRSKPSGYDDGDY